jgi:2'-5' RNA ligase
MSEPVDSYYSGVLGWVIYLDKETQSVAKKLAMKLSGDTEYIVRTPHITLYHATLNKVPRSEVVRQIRALTNNIGKSLIFNDISPYGGKFLFWDVENKKDIQLLHENLVDKYSRYLRKNDKVLAEKEGLEMSDEESNNLARYGHPLVKKLFRPHITLAYDTEGLDIRDKKEHVGKIINFQFVEIGKYGSIKKVLLSSNKPL